MVLLVSSLRQRQPLQNLLLPEHYLQPVMTMGILILCSAILV